MTRRRVSQRLHPVLTDTLNRLEGTALGQAFKDRAVDVAREQLLREPIDHAAALRPHLWLLERADSEGMQLTAAGYLKPATMREFAAALPTMHHWTFGLAKEVDAHPVLHFREYLKAIGLLRKYKGTLRLTTAGKAAKQEPAVLWRHMALALVPRQSEFDQATCVVTLVHMATTAVDIDVDAVARTMAQLGWRGDDGSLVDARDVYPVWNGLWDALGNVGAPVTKGAFDRALSLEARALVADALFEIVEDDEGR